MRVHEGTYVSLTIKKPKFVLLTCLLPFLASKESRDFRENGEWNTGIKNCVQPPQTDYIENITQWREDKNFMFLGQEQYLTHSLRSHEEYWRISKIVPKAWTNVPEHFLKIFEDCWRLSSRKTRRCFNHTPTNLSTNLISVKSSIYSLGRL